MYESIRTLLVFAAMAGVFLLAVSAILMALGKLGRAGQALARAPLLDLVFAALTWLPWLVAGIVAGWIGVAGTIAGQAAALLIWITLHEWTHRPSPNARSPRLVGYISQHYGRWRNHAALWITLMGLPVLWLIRITEIVAYPWLVW